MSIEFSILITTKNRISELLYTLEKINLLLQRNDVECIICDDGSTDDTYTQVSKLFPNIKLIRNTKSKGLIYSRNRLLENTNGIFAISIDDDLHFLSSNVLEKIQDYFTTNKECGVIGFRIFWGLNQPIEFNSDDKALQVKSYPGGAHAFRLQAWNDIPNYPDWFIFYGEEDFASYHLFKKNWQIHYVPDILVQHRVDLTSRKNNKDYQIRMRRSLRAGWYLMFLFFPIKHIPKRWLYSLWVQIKKRTLKGNIPGTIAILQSLGDLILHLPKIMINSNRLTSHEFESYNKLPDAKIYWNPK
jgi:glycosyltransferase involved in cell wall biosynthesis